MSLDMAKAVLLTAPRGNVSMYKVVFLTLVTQRPVYLLPSLPTLQVINGFRSM